MLDRRDASSGPYEGCLFVLAGGQVGQGGVVAATGSEADRLVVFRDVRDAVRARVGAFVRDPVASG